ncbi:hypothetical protein LX32DRAFT_184135 [Colletotrichum zoysiae]|uniref:Integral membrane protein n=1 Tax=Colletotrichum zoysiae TaxID=1216348 RepID=A0AAD9LYG9_9PEZI|nr:hypothetical protein LX32DRAFT_184135 [Colletotrichum zoysiae]
MSLLSRNVIGNCMSGFWLCYLGVCVLNGGAHATKAKINGRASLKFGYGHRGSGSHQQNVTRAKATKEMYAADRWLDVTQFRNVSLFFFFACTAVSALINLVIACMSGFSNLDTA